MSNHIHYKTFEELWYESQKEIIQLKKEKKKLRECVEFYEDTSNYDSCEASSVYWYIVSEQEDIGKLARITLEELEK